MALLTSLECSRLPCSGPRYQGLGLSLDPVPQGVRRSPLPHHAIKLLMHLPQPQLGMAQADRDQR